MRVKPLDVIPVVVLVVLLPAALLQFDKLVVASLGFIGVLAIWALLQGKTR